MSTFFLAAVISIGLVQISSAATFRTDQWPGGVVPFEFDANMSSAQRNTATAGMSTWSSVAAVTFRPRETFDIAWVHFRDSSSDLVPANYVGFLGLDGVGYRLGERLVNITDWNTRTSTHEVGHILGLLHEQNRADRDGFIHVEEENAELGFFNFNFALDPTSNSYGSYDFGSIMQYSACAFSTCGDDCSADDEDCRTITVLPPNDTMWQSAIGNGSTPSDRDALLMSFLYPEDDWRFVNDNDGTITPQGTFLDPWENVDDGVNGTPSGGVLWIQPGTYTEAVRFDRSMSVRAPLGGVTIRN